MTIRISKPEIDLRQKLTELQTPNSIAGQAILSANTPQEQFNLIGAGRKRLNINGAFNVWQRGTTTTTTPGQVKYIADRYKCYHSNVATSNLTWAQSSDAPPGFAYSFRIDCTTADTSLASATEVNFYHHFEGQDLQHLKKGTPEALPVTVSFWVKANVTGKFYVELMDNDNSNRHCNIPYEIKELNVWEYKTITFPGDTIGTLNNDSGDSFHVAFWLTAGSSYNGSSNAQVWTSLNQPKRAAGQYNFTNNTNNEIRFAGIQLEAGNVATPFEHRSYGEELALCERYYQLLDISGMQITKATTGTSYSNADLQTSIPLRTVMRTTPSFGNIAGGATLTANAYTSTYASAGSYEITGFVKSSHLLGFGYQQSVNGGNSLPANITMLGLTDDGYLEAEL